MKKIIKLSYFLFVSLAIVSCSSDDDDAEIFTNTIEYNNDIVDIEEAYLDDYGSYEGYYYYGISLEGTLGDDSSVEFYGDFASKDAESISTGTFAYYDYDEDATEHPDMFFGWSELYINGSWIEVVGGSIRVSKNSGDNSYSISGVLTLENDEIVTISYSGQFTYDGYDGEPNKLSSSPKSSRFFSVK